MKQNTTILLIGTLLFCCSCITEPDYQYRSDYQALLMTRIQLEKSVNFQTAHPLINTGKIYETGKYIFINEKYKGIHVIDNQDPKSPKNVGFISAPGCIDIAVKDNSLYLDNASDLVAVDISNLEQVEVTERVKNVFPELLPPDAEGIPEEFSIGKRPDNTIIVGWEKRSN